MFAGRDIRKEVFCGSFKMTEVHPSSATHDFSQSSVLNNSQKEHCRHLIHDTFMAVFKSIKKIFISFDLRFRLSFFYNFSKPILWLPQETELKSNWRNFFYDLRLGERNERLIYMIASRPLLRSTLTYETVFLLYVPFASMSLLTHFNLLINFLPYI